MSGGPLPQPVAALFPNAAERERIGLYLQRALERSRQTIRAGRVTPSVDMARFSAELDTMDLNAPQPLERTLEWLLAHLQDGIVQMSHPRYFGLFNPGANFPSQCADQIAALFNPQLASSASSPVPVALESFLIRSVAQRAGCPAGAGGHFANGGSEANFTALIAALTRAHADFGRDGVRSFPGPVTFYTSRDCHTAWLKIAHQAGVGRAGLRLIDTDGTGRMHPAALAAAITADRRAGAIPLMVVATAGTTGGGMIDPLEECADIAAYEGLWLHVDAAWGGAVLASDRLRAVLAGIERADSITVDAHKWFATTMGCGLFITRWPELLSEAFHAAAVFMPSSVSGIDPYLNSMQWSRRFIGLKFFLTLRAAGWRGLAEHVERAVAVIDRIKQSLPVGWTIANDSKLAVLNLLPPPGSAPVRELVKRVVASGHAWVAPAIFEGQDVVRICATHGETAEADIERLVGELGRAARPV